MLRQTHEGWDRRIVSRRTVLVHDPERFAEGVDEEMADGATAEEELVPLIDSLDVSDQAGGILHTGPRVADAPEMPAQRIDVE